MTDADQPPELSLGGSDDLAGRLWAFGEFATENDRAGADLATGLTSVGFIRLALRRGALLWCLTALAGLLGGLGALRAFPPSFQASTSILLGNNPFELPGDAAQDDQAMIQSRTVAADALRELGLPEDVSSLQGKYTVIILTNRVLVITVKQASSAGAVRDANALAAAFLAFQAHQLRAQEQLVDASLKQQIAAAQQHIDALSAQIKALTGQPAAAARRGKIGDLATERNAETGALTVLKQDNLNTEAATKIQITTLITGSQVLDPATPLPQHAKKYLVLYAVGGLIGGLVLGLFIVTVRALVSDRLRRRDDIARALGAPVKLSVGQVRISRWRSARRGLDASDWGIDVERIVAYLGRAVSPSTSGSAALAVVPVGDPQVAALTLVSLAVSRAQQGSRVVIADLCPGAPAARLLSVPDAGVHQVSTASTQLVVLVPEPQDVAPAGPLSWSPRGQPDPSTVPLATAAARADLLLTLAWLDPAFGGDHLSGWTRAGVAIVTAGQSSATRIHAVGEMMRLAGTEVVSAVLVGADKTDESLGLTISSGSPVPVSPGLS